jgi:hypothetical protein
MDGLIDAIGSDLIPLIEHAAPTLASALLSPFSSIVVALISHVFGKSSNDLVGLKGVLSDPALSQQNELRLRELEYAHAAQFNQLATQNYKIEVEDRMSARQQALIFKDFLRHMAYIITLGFFIALFMLFAPITISEDEKNLLFMLVGMLASKWQTIIDFFYGSHHKQGESK